MSFEYFDSERLRNINNRQITEMNLLNEIIRKQDRQIALLEGILRTLESQKDIWGRSNADY